MAEPALRLIDATHGEVLDPANDTTALRIAQLEGDLDNLERDLRKARRRIKTLETDKERDRQLYVLRTTVEAIFTDWRQVCKHPNSKLTSERFDAIQARIEDGYTRDQFTLALAGAAFDPFIVKQKNGRVKRFDDIELICRDGRHFEDFANKAPVTRVVLGQG